MKIRDDVLLTWLTAFGLHTEEYGNEVSFQMPSTVIDALVELGWLEPCDDEGALRLSRLGITQVELFAPETAITVNL